MTTSLRSHQILHKLTYGGAILRSLSNALGDSLSVADFGAKGDGVTDDSAAIQACITAAKAAGRSVLFPDGAYVIATLGTQSGRLLLHGQGNATIKGTLTYEQTFPASADTDTPLTPAAPYFHANGLNFQAVGASAYGLVLLSPEQPGFTSSFDLRDCRFYGDKGLYARYQTGFSLRECEFNNRVAGARFESCANGSLLLCRFQNQAESGVRIVAADGNAYRSGGENIKFSMCEWAVCTHGMLVDQHDGLSMDNCLMDDCAIPLSLAGSDHAKASNSRFGASQAPVARFASVPGYLAPAVSGVAVYGRPGGTPVGQRAVGFSAHNCEFVNSGAGSSQPIVYVDGYVDATYQLSGERVSFFDCLFLASVAHASQRLLEIRAARVATVIGCVFGSYNLSSSLADAYRLYQCTHPIGHSNDFQSCVQSGVQVGSSSEKMLASVYVQATDPGFIGAGNIWVQP
jgi:hypothetical protein